MGVDWMVCEICGETFPDCGEYYTCAKCENHVCSYCYEEQAEKYGIVDEDSDDADIFGDDALKKCDGCVKSEMKDKQTNDIIEILEEVNKLQGKEKGMIDQFYEKYGYEIKKLIKELKDEH